VTGVARPLVKGDAFCALTLLMAARERKLRWKFNASCLEAIASARCRRGWRAVRGELDDDPKLQIIKIEVHQRNPRD
jgi:hypothetical protein